MAQNISIVFGDNDHTSSLPRQIIGSEAVMDTIARSGGTLILEGPQSINTVVQQYYNGSISDAQLASNIGRTYHANDPQAAEDYRQAQMSVFINGKTAGTRIFFPESNSFYDVMDKNPLAAAAFVKIAGSLTSARCAVVQAEPILNSLPPEQLQAFLAIAPQLMARTQPAENQRIAETIKSQPAPYVVMYGDAHRRHLADALHAKTIVVMRSESDGYQGATEIPDYIYYVDTDRVLALPVGSAERAEFVARYAGGNATLSQGDFSMSLGNQLTAMEAQACISALPSDIVNHVSPPMPTPGSSDAPA